MRIRVREIRPKNWLQRIRFEVSRFIYPACDRVSVFTPPCHDEEGARVSVEVFMGPDDVSRMMKPSELIEALVYKRLRVLEELEQSEHPPHLDMNRHFMNAEIRSVHINCGRRFGHTTAIKAMFWHFITENKYPVKVCVPRYHQRRFYGPIESVRDALITLNRTMLPDVEQEVEGAIVLVDTVFMIDEEIKQAMMERFNPKMFVWLE